MLLARLKPYGGRLILICISSLVYGIAMLGTPMVYRFIFLDLLTGYSNHFLSLLLVMMGLLSLVSIVTNVFIHSQLTIIRSDFLRRSELSLMDEIIDYPYTFFVKNPPGRILELFGNDLAGLSEYLVNLIKLVLTGIQLSVMLIALLFILEPNIFALFPLTILTSFVWTFTFRRLEDKYGKSALKISNDAFLHYFEIFPKIREIKCYNLLPVIMDKLKILNKKECLNAVKATFFKTLISSGGSIPIRITGVVVFALGYQELIAGRITPGQIITNLACAGTVVYPALSLFEAFYGCYFMRFTKNKIKSFSGLPREQAGRFPVKELSQGIRISNLHFTYPPRKNESKGNPVLKGLDITIPAGSFCTIVGPSGCGKSTLVSILVKLNEPDKGIITLDQSDLNDLNTESVRRLIGLVPQDPHIIQDTLRRNIDPEGLLGTDEINSLCRDVLLDELLAQLPKGLNTVMYEKGRNLSGGEMQRIILARRLACGNHVMILDETTSALDLESEKCIIQTIKAIRERRAITFLGISHRPEMARQSDLIYVMSEGKIVETGTYTDLNKIGTRYHDLQLRTMSPDQKKDSRP